MIKLQTKHGCCWVEPDYVKAIYPLESEIAFSESGLAEVKCYAALENGETLELIEECDHPSLKISFGTFHLGSQYMSLLQIPRLVPRIATVQLGDGPRHPTGEWDQQIPGEGELPVTSIVQALMESDYNGFFEFDIWSRDVWERHYPDLLQDCREQLSRSAIVRR